MSLKFGTDGVRGVANKDLTPEFALNLGKAAGSTLRAQAGGRPLVILGRDTRISGPMLEASLAAGFSSVGVDVVSVGVVPTPTVSYLSRTHGFHLGGIVSASHNPAPDNGIKFVGPDGNKVSELFEKELEARLAAGEHEHAVGGDIGRLQSKELLADDYAAFVETIVPNGLKGLRIAVDAANGAASSLAPAILKRLGADIVVENANPDGVNINHGCGATHPETIQELTKESEADLGVAFDGDADRAIFSDSKGRLINGDRMIGIWAKFQKELGLLTPPSVVCSVMSNTGFERYLAKDGIQMERTPVGDKYVSKRLQETGALIGGEQSGHIVIPQHGPTGDGIVTALELFKVIHECGRRLEDFFDDFEPWPQAMWNIKVADKEAWKASTEISQMIETQTAALGEHGRVLVRASGTQPMVRLMVEAETASARDAALAALYEAFERHAGASIYSKVDLTYALGD
ncbi:MAG: phosphoglucosamine mutase [Armatimonadetes bacterium]|nr:phosphoglucosamine mutase [Armatimonadota bacterium]